MRKAAGLFFIFMFTITLVKAQKLDTVMATRKATYEMYMQKRRTNSTVGWITLGAGISMITIGTAQSISNGFLYTLPENASKGEALFIAGTITSLISIPFFISAHSNKRKARLALKGETVNIGNKFLYKQDYTAVAFTINL